MASFGVLDPYMASKAVLLYKKFGGTRVIMAGDQGTSGDNGFWEEMKSADWELQQPVYEHVRLGYVPPESSSLTSLWQSMSKQPLYVWLRRPTV